MASPDGTIPRTTLVDTVTERVRLRIVAGEILPGERIRVGILAKEFGISHIPIREALRRLETEGLIITLPQRGSVVADVGLDDLEAIWDLRRLVEAPVARRAASSATDADIVAIEHALDELRGLSGDTRSPEFRDAHRAFHWSLIAPGATVWIRRTLEQSWHGSDRYIQLFFAYFDADIDAFIRSHEELANAAKSRDPVLLERLLLNHIAQTEDEVKTGLLAASRG